MSTSPNIKRRRAVWIALGVLVVLVVVGLIASNLVARALKQRVIDTLGPLGSAESIEVGLTAVHLHRVRLRAPDGWPDADPLRADTIDISPDLRELISRQRIRIRRVNVDHAYISMLRGSDGKVQILPNLKQSINQPPTPSDGLTNDASPKRNILIGPIHITNSTLDFFDETVGNPPQKTHLTSVTATVGPLSFPNLEVRTTISVNGILPGPQHNGSVAFGGWIILANKDSDTTTTLRNVDVSEISPYLTKSRLTGLRSGTMDLDLRATVTSNVLHAAGAVTLADLELESGRGVLGNFLSMPRQAALNALKNRDNKIKVSFDVDGNLQDPHFSINESVGVRLAAGLAKALGVSVQGVAEGATSTVKGLGDTVKGLLGQ
jgi:hypothetical protein